VASHPPEIKVLQGRLRKLRQAITDQTLPNQFHLHYSDLFYGQNFPLISENQQQMYQLARRSWAALLLASLGAFLHSLVGPAVAPLCPGTTQAAFPSVMAFFTAWCSGP